MGVTQAKVSDLPEGTSMSVTLASIFRNSASYLRRYWNQIEGLRELMDVRVVGTWGDSDDYTLDLLKGRDMELHEYHHGGRNYGSVDHPARWDDIAKVVRHTLDMVGDPGDGLIWVESDLIWKPVDMAMLVSWLRHVPAVAPKVFASQDPFDCGPRRFYDIWGFRQGGQMFGAYPPYWQGEPDDRGLVKIDSCGSCFVTKENHWRDWTGHWPYSAGGELWLDTDIAIRHP